MLRRFLDIAPLVLLVIALAAGLYLLVWAFVTRILLPPDTLTIAAGQDGGAYHSYAERYRAILAWDGIRLEVLETAGSPENVARLASGEADVALVQGGIPFPPDAPLEALAAVFLEPFFIFYRRGADAAIDPAAWDRLRVAAGAPGSGTRAAVDAIVQRLNLRIDPERLRPLGGADAAAALQDGTVDIAVFVAPVDAPYLEGLLADPEIAIGTIRDTEALARRLPFVRRVDIPAAGLDYARRLPPEPVPLTAVVTTMAAQDDLHPALTDRLVRAARRVHGGPNLLSEELEFPGAEGAALPMDRQARSILNSGPSPLDGVLPFWITAQITTVIAFLVPLLVLTLPILRLMPGLYATRMRHRVFRFYNRLSAIEAEAKETTLTEERRQKLVARLDTIDREISEMSLPVRFRELSYSLRVHLDLVRRHLTASD